MTSSDTSHPIGRRTLLQAGLLAPAAVATPALLTQDPAHAGTGPRPRFDADDPRFVLAVVPDTQYLFDADSADPVPLAVTYEYLVSERTNQNIAFMTHLGDVVEHGKVDEFALADRVFTIIDGRLPYSVLAGNHDIPGRTDDQRGDTPYLRTFGPQRFAGTPTFGGASPGGYNTFHVFWAADRQWLVLALDWRMSDVGIAWAQDVIDAHATLPVILTTHELVGSQDDGTASLSGYGQQLWDQLIKRNDQIFLTLNGHYWGPGRTVLQNDAGHDVHAHITNYQDRYYGGAGMVRLYHFDLARGVIDVETFSPWILAQDDNKRNELEAEIVELSSNIDRFSVEINFAERFDGFAPVVHPAPRPAAAVVSSATVAYWRFDAAGLSVPGTAGSAVDAGTVVRDLTRNGNDLTVKRLASSDPSVLTWSAEHHEGQPAHASLLFGGGKNPDRGAILEARAGAPVNSVKLETGYTIEAFIKLPAPFVGDHAFMGLMSWEGRASDSGKTNGYSPTNESPVSLNLSSERFLQYVVYPAGQDASPTSWSHAIETGRWTHIAVVNNSKMTVVYVDGSKIVRNPRARSTGIATVGKPFVIGGTQWAENFGQGYYGYLGDVRITAKALRPSEFLAPYTPDFRPASLGPVRG